VGLARIQPALYAGPGALDPGVYAGRLDVGEPAALADDDRPHGPVYLARDFWPAWGELYRVADEQMPVVPHVALIHGEALFTTLRLRPQLVYLLVAAVYQLVLYGVVYVITHTLVEIRDPVADIPSYR